VVFPYFRISKLLAMRLQLSMRAVFVLRHQATVSSHISGDDRSKVPFQARLGHFVPPDGFNHRRKARASQYVRFWPKADMASALHMSAFGGKADIS
jgi:hypothetical protein